jgi:flagellar P-ring protein precursor FlgI
MPIKKTTLVLLLGGLTALLVSSMPREGSARVRLENICTIYGQKEIHLTGMGLVIGLNGTGDGGKSIPAIQALSHTLLRMNSATSAEDLRDTKNVAIVLIEATVPRTGLRRGQKIDCYVSSIMGAKSLRGGRLLVTPLQKVGIRDEQMVALASGPIYTENSDLKTVGKIPGGVVLQDDFISSFIDVNRGHILTLLLDAAHSSFHSASEVADVVNSGFNQDTSGFKLARAIGPGVIEVQVPAPYHDSPVEFVALVLEIGIDNPHTQARVLVNAKSETVIITGEVEISPAVISHKNLTVEVVGGAAAGPQGAASGGFVQLMDPEAGPSPPQLSQLLGALQQLNVPTSDVIEIIRLLHKSGKLHAEYIEL